MPVAGRRTDDGSVDRRGSGLDLVREAFHALRADGVGLDVQAPEPVSCDGYGDVFSRVRRAE